MKMRIDSLKHKFLFNHNNFLLKLVLTIFFFGLAFRIFFHSLSPLQISNVLEESPFPQTTTELEQPQQQDPPVSLNVAENPDVLEKVQEQPEDVSENEDRVSLNDTGKCDYLSGDWVPNPLGPAYTNETCNLIEPPQDCLKNGRPDRGFLYWRWAPRDCELPQFDPQRFLNMMRNKAWALVGDSISRNHVQSLLCMLSSEEQPVMVYHDEGFKSKTWHFRSHNFSVSVIWSPFLVQAAIFEDMNGVSTTEVELHLDKLDSKWTDQYRNFDYIIFSTGKWFLKAAIYYENGTVIGCHSCPNRNFAELGFEFAYRKALRFVLNFITSSGHKGLIFFRTFTPDHFEYGEWFSGGTCNRTGPIKEGEMEMKELNMILRNIELEEFKNASAKASRNAVNFKLIDFAPLSLLRPDGHPGPYRQFQPFANGQNDPKQVQNDCLHWCLPGPIDSWNEIIMQVVLNE